MLRDSLFVNANGIIPYKITIPKIRELNAEYERVLREKKETYAEYRKAQQDMKELQIAKHNVEQLLKKEEQEHQDRQKKKDNPLDTLITLHISPLPPRMPQ